MATVLILSGDATVVRMLAAEAAVFTVTLAQVETTACEFRLAIDELERGIAVYRKRQCDLDRATWREDQAWPRRLPRPVIPGVELRRLRASTGLARARA
jgi:hypothetical protein